MNKQEIIDRIQANRVLLETFSVQSLSVFGSRMRSVTCLGDPWIWRHRMRFIRR